MALIVACPLMLGLWDVMTFQADGSQFRSGHPSISSIADNEPSRKIPIIIGVLLDACILYSVLAVWFAFKEDIQKLPPCDYCGMQSIKIVSKKDGFSKRAVCVQHL